MRLKTVTYTGTGGSQSITGVGFQPDGIFVKDASTHAMYLRHKNMAANTTNSCDGNNTISTTGITTLDADGFSLGADATQNANGNTYYAICLKDDGGGDIKFGTYTGNGVNNHSITGVGFAPNILFCLGAAATSGDNLYWTSTSIKADTALGMWRFAGTAGIQTVEVKTLDADGFTMDADGGVNGSGKVMVYIAFKRVTGFIEDGKFTGNAADNRNITNSGAFQPNWVVLKTTAQDGIHKPDALAGDATMYASATADTTDRIQAINSNGFQVGTNAQANGSSATVYYINLLDNPGPPQPSVNDTEAATDVPTVELDDLINVNDTEAATDVPSVELDALVNVVDTEAATDVPTVELDDLINVGEDGNATDVSTVELDVLVNISEDGNATDVVVAVSLSDLSTSVAEDANMGESVEVSETFFEIDEVAVTVEVVTLTLDTMVVSVGEDPTVTDVPSIDLPFDVSVFDLEVAQDLIAQTMDDESLTAMDFADNALTDEFIAVELDVGDVSIVDSLTLTESVSGFTVIYDNIGSSPRAYSDY